MMVGTLGEEHQLVSIPSLLLARIHAEEGKTDSADRLFREAVELRRGAEKVEPEKVQEAVEAYAEFLRDQGRGQEAESGGP